jgi:hypothetical protein
MPLTADGWNAICDLMTTEIGATPNWNPFSNTYALIGVGDNGGSVAQATTNHKLGGTTNTLLKRMDTSYPSTSSGTTNTITFQATFGPTDANFDWNEDAVFNGGASNLTNASYTGAQPLCMLSRTVEVLPLQPKTSTESVVYQKTITIQS